MKKKNKIPETDKTVPLDRLLDFIAKHVYDPGHGLLGPPCWAVDAVPLLDHLRDLANLSRDEMADAYDWARVRVHGPNVKGGR